MHCLGPWNSPTSLFFSFLFNLRIISLRANFYSRAKIIDEEEYQIAGVQNYGRGVVIRRTVKGSGLTMKKYQVIDKNQLMWCKVDTKNGAFGLTHSDHKGALASTNMVLAKINEEKYLPRFIETLFKLKPFYEWITKYSSGSTNRKYLTPSELLERVEIPDLTKSQQIEFQERIDFLDSCGFFTELTHQQTLLDKLRQAILQEAIEGKLTAAWRKENPTVEPAAQLLARIRAEKAQLVKEKKIAPQKTLSPIKADEIPFELPEGWVWVKLEEIASVGTGATPLTSEKEYYGGDINWMTSSDTGKRFVTSTTTKITHKALKETNCKIYPVGTLVIAMYGQGKTRGQITELKIETATNQACAAISLYLFDEAMNQYVKLFFQKIYDEIRELAQGGAQPNLNMGKIKSTMIPLPPLAEQKAIVAKVESLLARCEELAQQNIAAQSHAAQLMQAVLKEAFQYNGQPTAGQGR
jgi:type I restriction enzyme, S subunit